MIAFSMKSSDGKTILGLGITSKNIENLKEGKPILKEVDSYVDNKIDKIFMMYGETEFKIMGDLKKAGLLNKNTRIHSEGFIHGN